MLFNQLMKKTLYVKNNWHILDAGCGPGSISLDLASWMPEGFVTGIDLSSDLINFARKTAQQKETINIKFETGDFTKLDFAQHSFDAVFTHAALWPLKNPENVLREFMRVTKPGGKIACREPIMQGCVFYPDSKILKESLDLQQKAQKKLNNDSNLGAKLIDLFAQAGLRNIKLSSSCTYFGAQIKPEILIKRSLSYWDNTEWAKEIRRNNWASESRIQEYKNELIKWGQHPGSFASMMWGEVVGEI